MVLHAIPLCIHAFAQVCYNILLQTYERAARDYVRMRNVALVSIWN